MENDTKFFYEVTPEVILSSVEQLGQRCTGKIIQLNSLENRVYDVELDIEDSSLLESKYDSSKVIKFYRPGRWSLEQIKEEHRFIKDLENNDLPVVSALKLSDGETVRAVEGHELYFSIFPKVGGRIIDEFSDSQIELLGRLIARIHLTGRERKAEHRIHLTPTTYGRDNLKFLIESNSLPSEIQDRYIQLVNIICDITDSWYENIQLQRVHGDFHIGNILWTDQGCKIVDFDDFVVGPAIQDIWLICSGREEWSVKQRNLLIESYSSMIEFDHETIRLLEPLRALRLIHFSAWIAKRWEDPAFPNIFPDFGSHQYWREQLVNLEEILQIMQCGEIY